MFDKLTDVELYELTRKLRRSFYALDRVSYKFNSLAAYDTYAELRHTLHLADAEVSFRQFVSIANMTDSIGLTR